MTIRSPIRSPKQAGAGLIAGCALIGALLAPTEAQAASGHVWYVSASAAPGGDGSVRAPFNTLASVEQASGPDDTIIVEPSPLSVAPLDGGITLKPGQRLIGGGPPVVRPGQHLVDGAPPVVGPSHLSSLPRITNTSNATNNGDAVDLANDAAVTNLVISDTYRGGIYGLNVTGVDLRGNDVSGQNTSGTNGFIVLPFYLETYTPFIAIRPTQVSLHNGWAGIMVDASQVTGNLSIEDNYVHDGSCGDGIDIRTMGTADLSAQVKGNFLTRLHQCSVQQSLEGIGTQASGSSTLQVDLNRNTEASNGNPGANADSLFVNPAESGTLNEIIDHNAFVNGIGGASTNGLEDILSNGNAVSTVSVLNSTFRDDPGDMLEEFDRGVGSKQTLTLNHVLVEDTTISGGVPSYAEPAGSAQVPDNTGECLGIGSVGASDETVFEMQYSQFLGCDNNGIEVTNNHVTGDGVGNVQSVALDITHSVISGSRYYNLWINNLTPLNDLSVRVQDSDLATSANGVAVAFDQQPTGSTESAAIDLGGGALGSPGENCIYGGAIYNLEATDYNVAAEHDWWGSPAGPTAGTVSASSGYTINDAAPLTHVAPACNASLTHRAPA